MHTQPTAGYSVENGPGLYPFRAGANPAGKRSQDALRQGKEGQEEGRRKVSGTIQRRPKREEEALDSGHPDRGVRGLHEFPEMVRPA